MISCDFEDPYMCGYMNSYMEEYDKWIRTTGLEAASLSIPQTPPSDTTFQNPSGTITFIL